MFASEAEFQEYMRMQENFSMVGLFAEQLFDADRLTLRTLIEEVERKLGVDRNEAYAYAKMALDAYECCDACGKIATVLREVPDEDPSVGYAGTLMICHRCSDRWDDAWARH